MKPGETALRGLRRHAAAGRERAGPQLHRRARHARRRLSAAGPTPPCSPSAACSRCSAARSPRPPSTPTCCAISTPPWARASRNAGWVIRLYLNPLAPWIWLGAALCALGGFVSLSDRRLRIGAPSRRPAVQPARMTLVQRRLLFLLPLLTLALMAGFFAWSLMAGRDPASIGSVLVGRPAPRLDLPALRDGDPPLTDALLHTGKPVLVNFFASWCTPCLAEHPLFTRLAQREGATIIGIAWKNKPEEARAWLKRWAIPSCRPATISTARPASTGACPACPRPTSSTATASCASTSAGRSPRGIWRDHPAVPQGRRSETRCSPSSRCSARSARARRRAVGDAVRPRARSPRARRSARRCAASSARTSRSTIRRPRWRATCAAPCASG